MYILGKPWRADAHGGLARSVLLGIGESEAEAEAKDLASQDVRPTADDLRGSRTYMVVTGGDIATELGDYADVVLESDLPFWRLRGRGMETVVVVRQCHARAE